MVVWRRFNTLTAVVIGTGAGLTAYYYKNMHEPQTSVYNSWTNCGKPLSPCAVWDTNWDYREPPSLVRPLKNDSPQEQNRFNSELEKKRATTARHIILVRHGEYTETGDADSTHNLTERGRLQAKYTGLRLHDMGIIWEKAVVSTMTRAQETAEIILKQMKTKPKSVKNCDFIREGAPIPPQPAVGHWRPEEVFYRDGARIEAGFRRYFHRALPDDKFDTHTLIVGHGNVIRYFVCRALQLPPEAWLRFTINHGSITWLTISPTGNVSIKYMGDSGYMPVQFLTNRMPPRST